MFLPGQVFIKTVDKLWAKIKMFSVFKKPPAIPFSSTLFLLNYQQDKKQKDTQPKSKKTLFHRNSPHYNYFLLLN